MDIQKVRLVIRPGHVSSKIAQEIYVGSDRYAIEGELLRRFGREAEVIGPCTLSLDGRTLECEDPLRPPVTPRPPRVNPPSPSVGTVGTGGQPRSRGGRDVPITPSESSIPLDSVREVPIPLEPRVQ